MYQIRLKNSVIILFAAITVISCTSKKEEKETVKPASDPVTNTTPEQSITRNEPQSESAPVPEEKENIESISCKGINGTWSMLFNNKEEILNDECTITCRDKNNISLSFNASNKTLKSVYPVETGRVSSSEAVFAWQTNDAAYTMTLKKQQGGISGSCTIDKRGNSTPKTYSVELKKP